MKYFLLVFLLVGGFSFIFGETLKKHQLLSREEELLDSALTLNEIIEAIRAIISAITNNINQTIQLIRDNLEEIIRTIKDKIGVIIQASKDRLERLLKEIEDILRNLKDQSEHARECVKKYDEEIKEAAIKAREGLELCGSNASEHIRDIQKNIQSQIESVSEHLQNVENIIKECIKSSMNPIAILRCGVTKASEINTEVKGLLSNVSEAVTIASQTLMEIFQESGKCTANVVSDYRLEAKEIRGKIQKCIEEKKHISNIF